MAALVLACFTSTAWADDVTKKVEELSMQAAQAYGDGDFEESIALFEEAYELQPVANLLFNIAKVYEKVENWEKAEQNYKAYVKSPDADSKAREVAMERIDAIQEIRAAELAANKPVEEPVEKPKEEPVVEPAQQPKKRASALPWVVIGSGAVLAGTGAVFGILASGKQTQFEEADTADDKLEFRKSGKTFALVADGLFAAGAVAGIVGVILLITSGGSDSAPQQASAVTPTGWVGPHGQAGFGMNVRF